MLARLTNINNIPFSSSNLTCQPLNSWKPRPISIESKASWAMTNTWSSSLLGKRKQVKDNMWPFHRSVLHPAVGRPSKAAGGEGMQGACISARYSWVREKLAVIRSNCGAGTAASIDRFAFRYWATNRLSELLRINIGTKTTALNAITADKANR